MHCSALLPDGTIAESTGNWILVNVLFWGLLHTCANVHFTFNLFLLLRAVITLLHLPWHHPLCDQSQESSHQFESNQPCCSLKLAVQFLTFQTSLMNVWCLLPTPVPCVLSSHLTLLDRLKESNDFLAKSIILSSILLLSSLLQLTLSIISSLKFLPCFLWWFTVLTFPPLLGNLVSFILFHLLSFPELSVFSGLDFFFPLSLIFLAACSTAPYGFPTVTLNSSVQNRSYNFLLQASLFYIFIIPVTNAIFFLLLSKSPKYL